MEHDGRGDQGRDPCRRTRGAPQEAGKEAPLSPNPYRFTLHEEPGFLHAQASGEHTPENARRFLMEAYQACVARGYSDLLLDVRLTGPSLGSAAIFGVLQERSPQGAELRRIAYVDSSGREVEPMKFAETVARNRGVNVRHFASIDEAKQWLAEGQRSTA